MFWFGVRGKRLLEQTYPGLGDHRAHFAYLLPAFSDDRYVTVDGKPLFYIYDPFTLPDMRRVTDLWRELAHAAGLKGLFLVGRGLDPAQVSAFGCDAANYDFVHRIRELKPKLPLLGRWAYRHRVRSALRRPILYTYQEVMRYLLKPGRAAENEYPSAVPNWDSTPRAKYSGMVYLNGAAKLYGEHLRRALATVAHGPREHRLVFVKSWNEWGEGNYLEPDRKFGRAYLEAIYTGGPAWMTAQVIPRSTVRRRWRPGRTRFCAPRLASSGHSADVAGEAGLRMSNFMYNSYRGLSGSRPSGDWPALPITGPMAKGAFDWQLVRSSDTTACWP